MNFQGQCAYSDQVQREGCSSVEVFKFECPKVKDARHEHPRYPDAKGSYKIKICRGKSLLELWGIPFLPN